MADMSKFRLNRELLKSENLKSEYAIDEYIENLTDWEKKFALWILIKSYREDFLRKDLTMEIKDKNDFMVYSMAREIDKQLEVLHELLGYELW